MTPSMFHNYSKSDLTHPTNQPTKGHPVSFLNLGYLLARARALPDLYIHLWREFNKIWAPRRRWGSLMPVFNFCALQRFFKMDQTRFNTKKWKQVELSISNVIASNLLRHNREKPDQPVFKSTLSLVLAGVARWSAWAPTTLERTRRAPETQSKGGSSSRRTQFWGQHQMSLTGWKIQKYF